MSQSFSGAQKEYLAGFMAAVAQRGLAPFAGLAANGRFTADEHGAPENLAAAPPAPKEDSIFGTPISELCKQEQWKLERHGLDIWDRLTAHTEENKFPDDQDTFYFRYHGLFYVAPTQNSFMLRCRIPAGEVNAHQLRGLAHIAETWGGGYAHVTTRANLQIREIAPRNLLKVLAHLHGIGLTAKGAGVDNIRNLTVTPTAGFDPEELIDPRALAHALSQFILNSRDMFGLPRKFNIAFDGGGSISCVADTNDIGFVAVRLGDGHALPPGVYFRLELAGITGHKQFAADCGVMVRPEQCLAVAAAVIRAYAETGDRTNRNRARLKYVVDRLGLAEFLRRAEAKLDFVLPRLAREYCEPRPAPRAQGWLGIHAQRDAALRYAGVAVPVGFLTVAQLRGLATLAERFGTAELRLTVWQNLLIPNVPEERIGAFGDELRALGLNHTASPVTGGLVACTGNTGCKWAATATKAHALELGSWLEERVPLDVPVNIHLTGCPHSCAQHFIGDIGLLGTRIGPEKIEGYHVFIGGGSDDRQGLARQIATGVPFAEVKPLLVGILQAYLDRRESGETFRDFAGRLSETELGTFAVPAGK